MNNEELKEKASAALGVGVAVAKKLGNAACELGKEGIAAAKAKAQEMREAREAQKSKEAAEPVDDSAPLAGLAGFETGGNAPQKAESAPSSYDGASESSDVKFIIRGWLYGIYWIVNVLDTIVCIACISIFGVERRYSYSDGVPNWTAIWIIIGSYLFALLMNRLWYEISIAIFEIVKHLRQIRDELRKAKARSI